MRAYPKISVIVPIYNVEKYLEKCLGSIINQTYKNLEIICVNDGSTDNSLEILKKYSNQDSRIIIIDKKNGGLSSARNEGLKIATGEFIGFVDSDDYIESNTYEECILKFKEDITIDMVCFSFKFVYENSEHIINSKIVNSPFEGKLDNNILIGKDILISVWSKLFRKAIVDKYNICFINGVLYEDNFFTNAFLLSSEKSYFINKPLYNYRQRVDSITGRTRAYETGLAIDLLRNLDELFFFSQQHSLSLNSKYLSMLFIKKYIEAIHIEKDLYERKKIDYFAYNLIDKYEAILQDTVIYNKVIGDTSYQEQGKVFIFGCFAVQKCFKKVRIYIHNFRLLTMQNPVYKFYIDL